jgi:hypothetical protein
MSVLRGRQNSSALRSRSGRCHHLRPMLGWKEDACRSSQPRLETRRPENATKRPDSEIGEWCSWLVGLRRVSGPCSYSATRPDARNTSRPSYSSRSVRRCRVRLEFLVGVPTASTAPPMWPPLRPAAKLRSGMHTAQRHECLTAKPHTIIRAGESARATQARGVGVWVVTIDVHRIVDASAHQNRAVPQLSQRALVPHEIAWVAARERRAGLPRCGVATSARQKPRMLK